MSSSIVPLFQAYIQGAVMRILEDVYILQTWRGFLEMTQVMIRLVKQDGLLILFVRNAKWRGIWGNS
jgi:hypothetical protein